MQAPATPSPAPTRPWHIALAGLIALSVAMGIGRFAFTPLLPMMLSDGVVDLAGASWLASANYLGYLFGAVLCTFQPWLWARIKALPLYTFSTLVRGGLVTTCVLTLAMAWHAPTLWPLLRFAAGMTSAVVFVFTSGWCLSRLARMGVPAMGGVIYMGPGAGIVVSGLLASGMVALQWTAAAAWAVFAVLALALSASVWRVLRGGDEHLMRLTSMPPPGEQTPASQHPFEMSLLTVAYGLAGFGYIITATYLPVIARAALPNSAWLDLFWPIFGAGVMLGAWLATHVRPGMDFRWWLMGCYLVQALGIAWSLVSPSLIGFAGGSLLLGIPFTAITFFAMQEIRRLRPLGAASFMGLATATYGLGMVLGPPLVTLLLARTSTAAAGFTLSLQTAVASLLIGAGLYGWLVRAYPVRR